jgi:hypothetical protein
MLYEEEIDSYKFKYATKIGGWSSNDAEAVAYFKRWAIHTWGKEWGNEIFNKSDDPGGGWEPDLRRGFVAGFLSYKERVEHDIKIATLQKRKYLS